MASWKADAATIASRATATPARNRRTILTIRQTISRSAGPEPSSSMPA